MTISIASRQHIRQRAHFLCEYCHSSEEASASLFTFDHLMPRSLGGADTEDNLLLPAIAVMVAATTLQMALILKPNQ